jgi:hypothetical protein
MLEGYIKLAVYIQRVFILCYVTIWMNLQEMILNKLVTETEILHDSTYMKDLKELNHRIKGWMVVPRD